MFIYAPTLRKENTETRQVVKIIGFEWSRRVDRTLYFRAAFEMHDIESGVKFEPKGQIFNATGLQFQVRT